MFPTRSCEIPNLAALWRADSRRFSITISRTRSLFSDVAAVEGLLDIGSASTASLSRFNWLTQHLSMAYKRASSPDVPCKVSRIWNNVIPFNCRYLIASWCSNFSVFLETQNMSTLRAWEKIIKNASNELTIQKRYKYVIYFTDKIWLSHLFVKYGRLKTFQSPLVLYTLSVVSNGSSMHIAFILFIFSYSKSRWESGFCFRTWKPTPGFACRDIFRPLKKPAQ